MNLKPDSGDLERGMLSCPEARDLIPLSWTGGISPREKAALERHLEECPECASESSFVSRIASACPVPPPDLSRKVAARLAGGADRGRSFPSRSAVLWGLPAAAVMILGLGIGLVWSSGENGTGELITSSFLDSQDEMEVDDWIVAGAPVLDALSDEVLVSLMAMEVEG